MSGVEILMIVAIVMQSIAAIIALYLVNKTRFSALWICCFIALMLLVVERFLQLSSFDGHYIPRMTYAWIGIVVSICFSIGVICALFLVRHVERMTQYRRLLENRLMTAVLRTEERSRAEFSRELHDGLGPLVSSAKMSLSLLSRAEMEDKNRAILQNTASVIDEAIRSLREISNNLSPHVLINFGLVRGINNFVDRIGSMHDVRIMFRTPLRDERFDSNIEVILYRVVCELINNSLKHSACRQITLSLTLENKHLRLEYHDDGRGFDPNNVLDSGMGLSNIRSRISSLEGTFRLNSAPGCGVTAVAVVSIDMPMVHLSNSDLQKLSDMDYDRRKKRKNRPRR